MRAWNYLSVVTVILIASPAMAQDGTGLRTAQAALQVVAATFPEGAKFAYLDLDRVALLSKEGKAATAKLDELRTRRNAEVEERSKQVESLEAKLAQSEPLLSVDASTRLRREFERAQIDFQRFTQDAQAEVQSAQQQMVRAFMQRLFPVVGQVATEKDLWAVFTPESGLVWHNPALDISEEVAERLDGPTQPVPKRP